MSEFNCGSAQMGAMKFRPRFSLKHLLIAVTFFCGLSAWMAWQIHIVRTREAMLSELKANGAKITSVIDSRLMQPGSSRGRSTEEAIVGT